MTTTKMCSVLCAIQERNICFAMRLTAYRNDSTDAKDIEFEATCEVVREILNTLESEDD